VSVSISKPRHFQRKWPRQKLDKIKHKVGHYVEYILEFDQETFPEEDKNKDTKIQKYK
jgi:hypothetical protein